MAEVQWIKVTTDVFNNRKILQIETLPDGDSIIVIWFKLLCLAGNINDNGYVYFTEEIPYTPEMLSTQFHRPLPIIKLALSTFESFGMIEIIDDMLHISSWERYQNIAGMEKIKEQTRQRVANYRARQKALPNVTCNVTVTQGNATEKIREDKNREDKKIDYNGIKNAYNTLCPSLPAIKTMSEARKKAIRARLNAYSVEDIEKAFKKAENSEFLKGKNNRNWQANFDWIMKDANIAKILDGNYDSKQQPKTANGFTDEDMAMLDDLF